MRLNSISGSNRNTRMGAYTWTGAVDRSLDLMLAPACVCVWKMVSLEGCFVSLGFDKVDNKERTHTYIHTCPIGRRGCEF